MSVKNIEQNIIDSRNIKPNSARAHVISLTKLNNNMPIVNLEYLTDKESIMKKLQDKALTTQKNYLSSILVALSLLDETKEINLLYNFYKKELDRRMKQWTKQMKTDLKTSKEEENWITQKEKEELLEQYSKNSFVNLPPTAKERKTLENYLVVGLYTLMPPRRLDYNAEIIAVPEDIEEENVNYLVNMNAQSSEDSDWRFILQDHKTFHIEGAITIVCPPQLNKIIDLYMEVIKPDKYLFPRKGNNITKNALGKLITRAFEPTGKKITINLIRKSKVSEAVDMKSVRNASKLAKSMGHSMGTQSLVYYKK